MVANHPADNGLKQHLADWGGSTATGMGPETDISRAAGGTDGPALGITACHSLRGPGFGHSTAPGKFNRLFKFSPIEISPASAAKT